MQADEIIPTGRKHKLPKGLSHLFGAQELSNLLGGARDYKLARVTFGDRGIYWHSQWQKILRDRGELKVLECHLPFWGDTWDFHFYSVPSYKRQIIRSVFVEAVFPPLTKWFELKNKKRFVVFFDLKTDSVRIESQPAKKANKRDRGDSGTPRQFHIERLQPAAPHHDR